MKLLLISWENKPCLHIMKIIRIYDRLECNLLLISCEFRIIYIFKSRDVDPPHPFCLFNGRGEINIVRTVIPGQMIISLLLQRLKSSLINEYTNMKMNNNVIGNRHLSSLTKFDKLRDYIIASLCPFIYKGYYGFVF